VSRVAPEVLEGLPARFATAAGAMNECANRFDYFSEIEETFIRRRGKPLLLSPLDWSLIDEWKRRGIPLHVVLRAIERTFDARRQSQRHRPVRSLAYCREEVEALFAEWLEIQQGRDGQGEATSEAIPRAELVAHLASCRKALCAARQKAESEGEKMLAAKLHQVDARLAVMSRRAQGETTLDAKAICDELDQLEEELARALFDALTPDERRARLRAAERELVAYGANDGALREMTERLLFKRLREERAIPRLSFFYL